METLLVLAIVAAAALFMGVRIARTIASARARKRGGGCGGGCCG